MSTRLACLLSIFCLGCQAMVGVDPVGSTSPALVPETINVEAAANVAQELWRQGQEAMKIGDHDRAIDCYRQCLTEKDNPKKVHLSLAAAFVAKGDEAAACFHLGLFLQNDPGHRNARLYHAELLMRTKRFADSRRQFDQVISALLEDPSPDRQQLLHCHGRLLEMAEFLEDDYQERLHRGISFYLLAQERLAADDPKGDLPAEGLLCKAAGQLTEAQALKPGEAKPCWYLHRVWRCLGQAHQASRWLGEAERRAAFSVLAPSEQRSLHLALGLAKPN